MLEWFRRFFQKQRVKVAPEALFLLECKIHGSHYYDCLSLIEANQLDVGELLILNREPNNEYDTNAIEILTQNGTKLGYVPQKNNLVLANVMDQHCLVSSRIASIKKAAWEPITVRITMELYK